MPEADMIYELSLIIILQESRLYFYLFQIIVHSSSRLGGWGARGFQHSLKGKEFIFGYYLSMQARKYKN